MEWWNSSSLYFQLNIQLLASFIGLHFQSILWYCFKIPPKYSAAKKDKNYWKLALWDFLMRNEVVDVTLHEWTYIRKVYFNNCLVLLPGFFCLPNFLYFSWDYNIIPTDTLNITSLYWMDDTETINHFELTQYANQPQLSQIFDERHTNWNLARQERSGNYALNINHL